MRVKVRFDHGTVIQEKYLDKCGGLGGIHARQHRLQKLRKDRQDCFTCFAHEVNDKIADEQPPRFFLTL